MAEQFPGTRAALAGPLIGAARFGLPLFLKWLAGNFHKRGFKGAAVGLLFGLAFGAEFDSIGDTVTLARNPEADVSGTLTEEEHITAIALGSTGGGALGFCIDYAIKRNSRNKST